MTWISGLSLLILSYLTWRAVLFLFSNLCVCQNTTISITWKSGILASSFRFQKQVSSQSASLPLPPHHNPLCKSSPCLPTRTGRTTTMAPNGWTLRNYSQKMESPTDMDRNHHSEYSGYNTRLHLIRGRTFHRIEEQIRERERTHQVSKNPKPKRHRSRVRSWMHRW